MCWKAAVSLNSVAYFIGGLDKAYSTTVDAYCQQTNSWSSTTLNYARIWHAATVVNDTIIVCGGINGTQLNGMSSCEQFDPSTQIWNIIASLPVPIYYHSMTTLNGRAYLFAGTNTTNWCQNNSAVYMFNGSMWTALNAMPVALREHASVAIDEERALICGGFECQSPGSGSGSGSVTKDCFTYNATSDHWMKVESMHKQRRDHSMVVYKGMKHVYISSNLHHLQVTSTYLEVERVIFVSQ